MEVASAVQLEASVPLGASEDAAANMREDASKREVKSREKDLSPEELASRLLDKLLGEEEDEESDSVVAAAVDVTGGDLTFGEDGYMDESFLSGLSGEIEQFQDDKVVSSIFSKDGDLKGVARDVEEKLRQVELESIQDYMKESDNLLSLHSQIKDCDAVLTHMEQLLGGFQADLGAVSAEIKDLQERSMDMAQRLRNRRAAEGKLGRFVDEMVVPPDLVTTIVDTDVSESYVRALQSLNRKLHFAAEEPSARGAAAMREVQPELERLRVKAVVRSREYLMQKIYALRKPKTNVHMLQQNVLLKYKYLAIFLKEHGRVVYTEVVNAYIDIMNKVLSFHLRTYISSLEQLQLDIVSRNDLIGADDSSPNLSALLASNLASNLPSLPGLNLNLEKNIFGNKARDLKNRSAVFSLGSRDAVLKDVDEPAIIPHIAEAGGHKYAYEVLFRSLHKLLMDTATSEFVFCNDFFGDESAFQAVFTGPFSVVEEHLNKVLSNCFDAIGLLLMIRMNQQHQEIMKARRVPCLDAYFDKINMLLWPRFKLVFDLQLGSVRSAHPRALWGDGDVHPHSVTRKYAEFTASLILLDSNSNSNPHSSHGTNTITNTQPSTSATQGDGQLEHNLERLRSAVDTLLVEMSRFFPKQKQRTVFLINNYDLILAVFKEACVEECKAQRHFEDLLHSFTAVFVEEELRDYFRDLVDFVRTRAGLSDESTASAATDGKRGGGGATGPGTPGTGSGTARKSNSGSESGKKPSVRPITAAEVEPHLKDFAGRWKSTIETIHKDVITSFSNFVCGMDILRAVLTQLLLYYTRLSDCLKRVDGGAALMKDVVSIPSIMYEIRKYSLTF